MKRLRTIYQILVILGMWLIAACGKDSEFPKVEIDHKTACELKTTALIKAAEESAITCDQAKPGLDFILANDPDCKAYFGDKKVEVTCDSAQ